MSKLLLTNVFKQKTKSIEFAQILGIISSFFEYFVVKAGAPKPRLLVCAPSNAGVDEIMRRLIVLKKSSTHSRISNLNLVRCGMASSVHPDVEEIVRVVVRVIVREIIRVIVREIVRVIVSEVVRVIVREIVRVIVRKIVRVIGQLFWKCEKNVISLK